jgi:hypothetical protein
MRLNTALVISSITLTVGFIFREAHLWIPVSIMIAALIDLLTRPWYGSNAMGEWVGLSIVLKFIFALVGFYATIGQLVCMGLFAWWLIA